MKKFIFYLILGIYFINFTSCSKDDEYDGFVDDNSPCYVDYFMNNYYDEYYYNGNAILDKRDVKNFNIKKYESSDGKYCVLLTIDYFERNSHGYISSILNTIDYQIKNELNSNDWFYTPENCVQILCKHPHCLNKYNKYNTK